MNPNEIYSTDLKKFSKLSVNGKDKNFGLDSVLKFK